MSDYSEPEAARSIVLFERRVDMEVWFRDDGLAEEAFGITDSRRWFQCGIYDVEPLAWASVLAENAGVGPVLLERVR